MVIRIDHKLRIALSELPPDIRENIIDVLTIPNVARQKAMEQNIWGWQQMPESIALWSEQDGDFVMPRGFYSSLVNGLTEIGLDFEIKSRLIYEDNEDPLGTEIALKSWQEPAVRAILASKQGIYKAPAGSGKTVAVLEAIRRANCPGIVLVNTKDILWQWSDRIAEHLGHDYHIGMIGEGVFNLSRYITVAMIQTLHSKYDDLEESGFFDIFSFMCLDECHHATADTYNRIVNRFSSRYRIGVSATPDKTGDFALAINVLGPVFHVTHKRDVDSIIEPSVFRILTSFSFPYRGASGRSPSNYGKLLQKLISDSDRNRLIAKSILLQDGSHSLIVTKRLEHIYTLIDVLHELEYESDIKSENEILILTGKESSEERQEVVKTASKRPCMIFSTLADEALDIPRLDSIFLVFPQRNAGLIEQQIGRILRKHPDKESAKIFDFHDHRVGPLDAQWKHRRVNVYQPHGYQINTVKSEEILECMVTNDC